MTYQARSAIAVALHHWKIGPGDEVLVPAYNCGTEIDPILKTAATVRLYRIESDLRLDLADIRRLSTERTRLICVIHYFGWPQDLLELRQHCDDHGIMLLEDCALALFSRGSEGWLGRQGDAAVFSLPKTLGVPDGGLLLLRKPPECAPYIDPPIRKSARKLLPLVKRFLLRRTANTGLFRFLDRPHRAAVKSAIAIGARPDIPRDYYFDSLTINWRMSRITQGLLMAAEPQSIIARRRHNYLRLSAMVDGIPGVRTLFRDLPAGVCPIGLPILVQQRRTWEHLLSARHIEVFTWWAGYHSGLEWDRFPEACRLKDQILLLPIHQQLDDRDVDFIGRQVADIARGTICEKPELQEPVRQAEAHAA